MRQISDARDHVSSKWSHYLETSRHTGPGSGPVPRSGPVPGSGRGFPPIKSHTSHISHVLLQDLKPDRVQDVRVSNSGSIYLRH